VMMSSPRVRIAAAAMALAAIGTSGSARAQSAATTATPLAAPPPTTSSAPYSPPFVDNPPVATHPVESNPIPAGFPPRHSGKRLVWDPSFNRMDAPEMVVTGIAAAIALAAAIAPPLKNGWMSGFSFDESARNSLRLSVYKSRLDARDVSDVGLALMTAFPILVDSMIVAYWYRGSDDVALQMTLIDAEAYAVASALQGAATFFGGRERPYGRDCGGQLKDQSIDCTTPSRYRSFFSGHSTLSFTSASLICAHHERLELFESAADEITCASGFVAAATIASMRVISDVHYVSDVLTGALIGTAVGLGIPLLHHYHKSGEEPSAAPQVRLVPAPNGVHVVGVF
jgi:membrane-associated phospholipid phosphatase